jgi:hypothetical protein
VGLLAKDAELFISPLTGTYVEQDSVFVLSAEAKSAKDKNGLTGIKL